MSTRDIALLTLIFIVGVVGIIIDHNVVSAVLLVSVPLVLLASGLSVLYMWRIMLRLPEPRPLFFRMLVGADRALILFGLIAGWLAMGILLEVIGIEIPQPDRADRGALLGLVVCILLSPSIYHAGAIHRERRRATAELEREAREEEVRLHMD